jgi:hypothetical protein
MLKISGILYGTFYVRSPKKGVKKKLEGERHITKPTCHLMRILCPPVF